MNKKTIALDVETYRLIIETINNGFTHGGISYRANKRVATVLVLEYNLGLRIGDILQLSMSSFIQSGERYYIDIVEQKTKKIRNFTVPSEVYQFIRDYAYTECVPKERRLFQLTERAVLKHLNKVCCYLNLPNVASHSFRKGFATNIYISSGYNIELVRVLLQHSSVIVTQKYIGIGSKELESAIRSNICLG